MDKIKENSTRPFGFRDKLGYLFGDFGNDFTFILSSSFLMKFYTDVMGIAPWIVGLIMTLTRFIDAFTDVTMGRICDKSRTTPRGKFKPWILRMCAPVAIASFLIYQSSLADASMAFKIVWLSVTYVLWGSIFYTSINIPYGSMASAISSDPHDRQSLSTYRSLGSSLAGLIVGVSIPLIAYDTVGGAAILNGARFTVIAGIFSLLSVVCYLFCYFLTTERVKQESHPDDFGSVRSLFMRVFKNRALLSLVAASLVLLVAQLTMQSMANYIYPNYYGNVTAQSVSTVIMVLGMFLAAAVTRPLVRLLGKAEISALASLLATAVCILLFFFRPENVWVYVAISAISYFGIGIFAMTSWALVTDVIDDAEIRHGVREDGSIYAVYSFSRKLGQAAASGLGGALLSVVGYSEATAFEPSVLTGIYNISTLVPGIGFALLAVILRLWYPLNKKRVLANVETLKDRR